MASAEDDTPEGLALGQGGEAGDWTAWLRSRLQAAHAPGTGEGDPEPQEAEKDDDGSPPQSGPDAAEQEPGPLQLGAHLQWPGHSLAPAPDSGRITTEDAGGVSGEGVPSAPSPQVPPPTESSWSDVPPGPQPPERIPKLNASNELVAGLERLRSAVTGLSARIDGLADATATFRSIISERLDEYAHTVLRAAKGGASDVEEYRRMHIDSINELRQNADDTAGSLRRLSGWMEELARTQEDDERWATALSQAFEEAAAERREGEEQTHAALSGIPERLERIERTLEELAEEPADPLVPVVRSLLERLERIEETMLPLGEELDDRRAETWVALGDEQLHALADAVADRLASSVSTDPGRPSPWSPEAPDHASTAPASPRRRAPIRAPSRSQERGGR